jgi:dihydrodipicolinate synthase/N-acetylneuraminate lyase
VEPYLSLGLDVFVGLEPLVPEGMERGAVGAVSGLATAWPEVVAELVHERTDAACARVLDLRSRLRGIPFLAAVKHVLVGKGVIAGGDVRPPLRGLGDEDRAIVNAL